MAIVGHWLHFSYSDMADMDLELLLCFMDEAKEMGRRQDG